MTIRVITLGTGGPWPDAQRNATCTLVRIGEETLVFDTGRGTLRSFAQKGVPFASVRALFVTHHHVDHIGELADFTIASWIGGRRHPLPAWGPPGTRAIYDTLMREVYARDVEFRTEGEHAFGPFMHAEISEVRAGPVHDDGRWKVRCAEMVHGHGLPGFSDVFRREWICLGYRIEAEGKVVTISGDGVRSQALIDLARGSDLHVQVCYLPASALVNPHLQGVAKHTLACSDTVGGIATDAGVKRMVLTHFRWMSQAMLDDIARDVRRDFAGPVHLANDRDEFEV